MNERIKELINWSYLNVQSQSGRDITYFDKTKFAELIVKECAEFVQFYYKDHMCEVIAHDMKQQFGVE